ncbi:MAG: class I SAM-dependent methyltransferase [Nitrospirota bacterium]
MPSPMYLTRIDRICRSVLTLNRDREFSTLKSMLALKKTDTVLDAGSGDGYWTASFAKDCGHIIGIDPGWQALQHAKMLYNYPNIDYVQSFGESLPFPDKSFDKVVSISCLEHFNDPFQGLREMARVLKPGGRLALSVDSLLPENSSLAFREWHKKRHFVTKYFSQDEMQGMLEQVGIKYEKPSTVHLIRSSAAIRSREIFIRRPRLLLPLFPIFYSIVRVADWMSYDTHGQMFVVTGTRQ